MSRKDWNFKGFFRPKLGDLQKKKKKKKKKKGLRQYSGRFFSQFRKFKRMRGGSFRMGGAIFHFSQKIGLKSTKDMRFCILHKPMGGLEPPPPPPGYATVHIQSRTTGHLSFSQALPLLSGRLPVHHLHRPCSTHSSRFFYS